MQKVQKTYGGYLPIELRRGSEYFKGKSFLRYNCAKAAVNAILSNSSFNKIYIPLYLCPNVCAELTRHGIPYEYYDINERLLPEEADDSESICFYLVDYFGIMDKAAREFAERIKKATVIFDLCHSFYCEPVMKSNVYNIYSAKKFFGVPDGAYLVAEHLPEKQPDLTYSSEYSSYIIKSLEYGTNHCYAEKKEADMYIGSHYGGMSVLAKRILESADYAGVKEIRAHNASLYDKELGSSNIIKMETGSVPYAYPFNFGINIKKQLVEEKIFVPTLWGHILQDKYKDNIAYGLSENTLFLPVDQRYNDDDILHIINTVKKHMEG